MSNIRPYVIINGVDSRTIQGLLITSLPPISKPAQRTLTETIDGRDGDSSIKLGYSAYDKSLGIALTFGYNVDDVISFFNSEGTIVFSNEPDKLYNFEIFEAIDFEKLIRFKTATVTIHTQPFKFSTTENPLEFTDKEFTVVNNGNTDSRPNIVITGEGLATMQINGKNALNIDFGDAEQTLLIDSEGMNAYHTENIKKVEAEITPKQDLHGFDSPFIDSDVVNKVPYLSRALAGTAERIGNYEFNKLVGGTVAFNQLLDLNSGSWEANGLPIVASNGLLTISGNATQNATASIFNSNIYNKAKLVYNHKYFIFASGNHNFNLLIYNIYGDTNQTAVTFSNTLTSAVFNCLVQNCTDSEYVAVMTGGNSYSASIKTYLIDLTQMLGASIADYIYSLEQANTGAGVAYFRALFSADYYPYNAGELMSVKASAHVTKKAGGAVIQTVALDPNLELRGIPKLDANNKLYYDGDTYSSDGSVSRRYGLVDLGSLDIVYTYADQPYRRFQATMPSDYKQPTNTSEALNLLAGKYYIADENAISGTPSDLTISGYVNDSNIYIINHAYTDAQAFKTAMSGVYILYVKATATSESAQAFNNPIAIDANGSEEFTDSRAVAIPVGHESYYANICDIEGFTEVNLVRAGVNLFNASEDNIIDGANICTISGNIITNTGANAYDAVRFEQDLPSGNYVMHASNITANGVIQVAYYDGSYQSLGYLTSNSPTAQIIVPTGVTKIRISLYSSQAGGMSVTDLQYELGSEATSYEAYAGEIFNKQFEQEGEPVTVYGGKYNFITGLLEITHYYFKGGFTQYNASNGYKAYRRYNLPLGKYIEYGISNMINEFGSFDSSAMDRNIIQPPYSSGECYLALVDTANADDVELCYELAEHIFIELDPETISALLGINNFYADTGEVTITFVNDGQDETQTGLIVTFDLDESDFNRGDLANRLVSGNYDNIRLKAGANSIKFTGSVSAVGFNKYSRWL